MRLRNLLSARPAPKPWDRYLPENTALLIALVGLPLAASWIPPNMWYGFRTPRSMSSPDEWYRANQLLGFYMIASPAAAVWAKRAVAGALAARFGNTETAWGIVWVCVATLAGIGACALHYALSG